MWRTKDAPYPLPDITIWSLKDSRGMGMALTMLETSLDKGRIASYTQSDSMRQLKSAVSNIYTATATAHKARGTMESISGKALYISEDALQIPFMERFAKRMKARMSVETKRNLPLVGKAAGSIMEVIEFELALLDDNDPKRHLLSMVAAYIAITYT